MSKNLPYATQEEVFKELMKNPEFEKEWNEDSAERQLAAFVINERIKRNMTQTQIAKVVGVGQAILSKIENAEARPTLKTISSIAKKLGYELKLEFRPIASN